MKAHKMQLWLRILLSKALRHRCVSDGFLWLAPAFVFWHPETLAGNPLRHSILETDSFESYQSLRSCFGLYSSSARILCLPTDYLIKEGEVKISILSKVEEASYRIYKKFSDKTIDQKFLDELFKEQNFQFASGAAKVAAVYRMTSLSFTPVSFSGAFKLMNPSLPEIHAGGFTQKVFRITQNFYWKNLVPGGDLLVSPSAFLADQTFFQSNFSAIDTLNRKPRSLVEKSSERTTNLDGSLAWFWHRQGLPSLSLQFTNTLSPDVCTDCDSHPIDVSHEFMRHSRVAVSTFVRHPVGKSVFAFTAPFTGIFHDHDPMTDAASYILQLSRLNTFLSFSPYIYSFGFLYSTEVYRIGLQYSDEKQDNAIALERQKRTNVFASLSL